MDSKQEYLEQVAEDNDCTLADLKETEEKLLSAIQSRLNKHWKRSRLRSGRDYWLFENEEGCYLALTEIELQDELQNAEVECDNWQLVKPVAFSHLVEFQEAGLTVAVPGGIARYTRSDIHFPIYVPFPDDWKNGERHSRQRLQELVSRYDLSPAEALDYWVVEHHNKSVSEWGGCRNVQNEAIYKNVRQAKEKLSDEKGGAAYKEEQIRAVSTDEVPEESAHDEENDLFYVPTKKQADKFAAE